MNVYDFDNTIYDGESALDFFFYYVKKQPSLLRYLPKVLRAMARYKAGKVTVEQALTDYAPFVEDFLSGREDLSADAADFWDGHMRKIKPFYASVAREDDVVVTASPEYSIREVCRRLGIKNCVCSLVDEKTGRITRLCMRSRKIPAFFEAFPDAHVEDFYTDSPENDAPLIEIAERAFLVKGNKITRIK